MFSSRLDKLHWSRDSAWQVGLPLEGDWSRGRGWLLVPAARCECSRGGGLCSSLETTAAMFDCETVDGYCSHFFSINVVALKEDLSLPQDRLRSDLDSYEAGELAVDDGLANCKRTESQEEKAATEFLLVPWLLLNLAFMK